MVCTRSLIFMCVLTFVNICFRWPEKVVDVESATCPLLDSNAFAFLMIGFFDVLRMRLVRSESSREPDF